MNRGSSSWTRLSSHWNVVPDDPQEQAVRAGNIEGVGQRRVCKELCISEKNQGIDSVAECLR